jgi:GT2 family glycosyltransferase
MTSVDVVVITYLRPEVLRSCLDALSRQTRKPCHVFVIDSSPDHHSENVVDDFPDVSYVRNPSGAGNMTNSRNVALTLVDSDVIAFLDDDAFANEHYIEELMRGVESSQIDLGCVRTLNDVQGEESVGKDQIGIITEDGVLLGNFAADPGRDVVIRHGIGASMFFTRAVLADLGGFREDFRGISGVREDADAFLRAEALGYLAIFVHRAVVQHIGAPQASGRRFDWRYNIAANRNHMVMLANNFGLLDPMVRLYVSAILRDIMERDAPISRRWLRIFVALLGLTRGVVAGLVRNGSHPRDPRRVDDEAFLIRHHLAR